MKIIDFHSGSREIWIRFSDTENRKLCYHTFDETPLCTANALKLKTADGFAEDCGAGWKRVCLPDTECEAEYSIFFTGVDNEFLFEIVRQSPEFLASKYDYNMPLGCNIAGRRGNVVLGENQQGFAIGKEIIFFGSAGHRSAKSGRPLDRTPELGTANDITRWLWGKDFLIGPALSNQMKYQLASGPVRLKMVEAGAYPLQCGSFRDLFTHIAVSSGLKVRAIGASNYFPYFSHLTSYTHGLCEIWIEELSKFVLYDPWYCGMSIVDGNSPIGVAELLDKSQSSVLHRAFAMQAVTRRARGSGGAVAEINFLADSVSLEHQTYDNKFGTTAPAYLSYFNHVEIKSVSLAPSSERPIYLMKRGLRKILNRVNIL